MAWDDDAFVAAFDMEAGDISTLATEGQKIQWYNEGQDRLLRKWPRFTDVTWTEGDRDVDLPSDFISLARIVPDEDSAIIEWRVWGQTLIVHDPAGAHGDGGARVFYWADWPAMSDGMATVTETSRQQDYACMYYALSRFYKKLSSNRAFYKRYATLVGQNAVTMSDLQQEADRYYQDFLDAREDQEVDPPAFYYAE